MQISLLHSIARNNDLGQNNQTDSLNDHIQMISSDLLNNVKTTSNGNMVNMGRFGQGAIVIVDKRKTNIYKNYEWMRHSGTIIELVRGGIDTQNKYQETLKLLQIFELFGG